VGGLAVGTKNPRLAETMKLAVETSSKVRVSYDDNSKTMLQARMEFTYVCGSRKVVQCGNHPPTEPEKEICETIRYAPCKRDKEADESGR